MSILLIEYVYCLMSIVWCTRVYMLQCVLSLAFFVFVQLSILVAARQQEQNITNCINKFGPILVHFHLG
jgi:hypothetical protein